MTNVAQDSFPPGWVRSTLGEIAVDRTGTIDPGKYPDDLFELYSVPSFPTRSPELILGRCIGSHKQTVERETVLLCGINPRINRVWIVSGDTPYRKIASTEWIPFSPIEGVFPRYLSFYLQKDELRDYLASNASGVGGSLMRVKSGTCSSFPFPLAPVPDQKRIVAEIEKQFTRLEAAVEALKRARTNLKRYRASVLKAACEGRLVPTEAELARAEGRDYEPADKLLARILKERRARWEADQLAKIRAAGKPPKDDKWRSKYQEPTAPDTTHLSKLPEGWVWASAECLGVQGEQPVLTGPFGTNMGKTDFADSGVPVLTIGCLTHGGIKLDKAVFVSEQKAVELERYRLCTGDTLFSRMATVGRAGVVTSSLEGALFNYHLMRLRLSPAAVLPEFFMAYVRGSEAVDAYVRDVNHGATRPGINTDQLLRMPIVLPPLAEQHRIVAEVERRLSVIDELEAVVEANLKRAERLRQSILKRAFEGKLVPQDPNDEPASVILKRIRAERAARAVRAVPVSTKRNGRPRA